MTIKDFTLHDHRFQCRIIHEHIGPYMTRQAFPGLFRILECYKGLNWTTQIKTELNLNLQNDTGVHRII